MEKLYGTFRQFCSQTPSSFAVISCSIEPGPSKLLASLPLYRISRIRVKLYSFQSVTGPITNPINSANQPQQIFSDSGMGCNLRTIEPPPNRRPLRKSHQKFIVKLFHLLIFIILSIQFCRRTEWGGCKKYSHGVGSNGGLINF